MNTTTAYRALLVHDHVPAGMKLFPVANGRHEPHLHASEWAVIDPTDRAIQWGELYLVRMSRGPMIWQVNRGDSRLGCKELTDCAWLEELRGHEWQHADRVDWTTVPQSDGPIRLECLAEQIIGRVVGIYEAREAALEAKAA